jgi:hypothetical protein
LSGRPIGRTVLGRTTSNADRLSGLAKRTQRPAPLSRILEHRSAPGGLARKSERAQGSAGRCCLWRARRAQRPERLVRKFSNVSQARLPKLGSEAAPGTSTPESLLVALPWSRLQRFLRLSRRAVNEKCDPGATRADRDGSVAGPAPMADLPGSHFFQIRGCSVAAETVKR